jgi:hypothetical protein
MEFYGHWKNSQLLLVADIESIASSQLRHALWYQSIDLSTDLGLKSHLITFPCSK